MTGRILIYGANGYTARLAVRVMRDTGIEPVLAGRNAAQVKATADVYGFKWRAFSLDRPHEIDRNLADMSVVLNMAGPFSATALPMAEACVRTRTHYLDITGEIGVFESLFDMDAPAKRAGIMLLPGVGFDVVPSDCLLAHVKRRLPTARALLLGVEGMTTPSRGTAKTAVESLGNGCAIRQDGRIEMLATPMRRRFDFGDGPVECVGVSWGDISTAWHSTGVSNIQVYFAPNPMLERAAKLGSVMRWLLRRPFIQRQIKKRIDRQPEGPDRQTRDTARMRLVAIALDRAGLEVESRLETPEAYALSARLSADIAARVADGAAEPGFQTPARFLGPDYILQVQGVTREDL